MIRIDSITAIGGLMPRDIILKDDLAVMVFIGFVETHTESELGHTALMIKAR